MAGDGEERIDDLDCILVDNREKMTRDMRAVGARRVRSWRRARLVDGGRDVHFMT